MEGAKREAENRGEMISNIIANSRYDTYEFFRYLHDEDISAGAFIR